MQKQERKLTHKEQERKKTIGTDFPKNECRWLS